MESNFLRAFSFSPIPRITKILVRHDKMESSSCQIYLNLEGYMPNPRQICVSEIYLGIKTSSPICFKIACVFIIYAVTACQINYAEFWSHFTLTQIGHDLSILTYRVLEFDSPNRVQPNFIVQGELLSVYYHLPHKIATTTYHTPFPYFPRK